MYSHIHGETPIKRFVHIGNDRVVAETVAGPIVLAATADHVIWTENLEGSMKFKNEQIAELGLEGERQLWITGAITESATDGLADLGWAVRPNLINEYKDSLCNPAVPKARLDG